MTPLEFLAVFRDRLAKAGIRFAITSGMACVHYGLQQNTKDSDWIIPAEEISKLVELLCAMEKELPPWRISYRSLFGSPLHADFMRHGWSSHLSIWERADSQEQHVDIFSHPPRVPILRFSEAGWADRDTVARMKKTDRPKDWPLVGALGLQMEVERDAMSLLHIMNPDRIKRVWQQIPAEKKAVLAKQRPLLRQIDETGFDSVRGLRLEQTLWECVNRERYGRYQNAWKRFYREWHASQDWPWPSSEPFWMQHEKLLEATEKFKLPRQVIASIQEKKDTLEAGISRAARIMNATSEELHQVLPPLEELLP
jgi:hypothetical protein